MKTSKQEILKIATYFFIKKGYSETSLSDISSAVGITKGSLFSHITNKESLYVNVLTSKLPVLILQPERCSLQERIDGYIQKLNRDINHLNNLFDNDISLADYMLFLLESSKIHLPSKKKMVNSFERDLEAWEACIQKAKEKGEIKTDVDVSLSAQLFHYVFFGNFYISAISNNLDVEQLKEVYYQLYNTLKE